MYNPEHFHIDDRAALFDLMRRFSFATLVTSQNGTPVASHLPFMVRPAEGAQGSLIAHMARANSQWRSLAEGAEALVIFQGEHAYISPSWYQTHPSVPTWNYAVVHAYGTARIIDDYDRVVAMLRELVMQNESRFAAPWQMDLPPDYLRKMVKGIVAFEIAITRLEGKFKLSQNRDALDRQGVIAALEKESGPYHGIARLMSEIESAGAT